MKPLEQSTLAHDLKLFYKEYAWLPGLLEYLVISAPSWVREREIREELFLCLHKLRQLPTGSQLGDRTKNEEAFLRYFNHYVPQGAGEQQ